MAKYRASLMILFFLLPLLLIDDCFAQTMSLDLGDTSVTSNLIQLVAIITFLSLAPSMLVVVTSFGRIVVVLSMLRSAIGVQQTPPNTVLIGLALFLTSFIMAPTFEQAWNDGVAPYIAHNIAEQEALTLTIAPFRSFMLSQTRGQDIALFTNIAKSKDPVQAVPLNILIPAFMISEIRRAFEIGFLLQLPFLVIDMVVASILTGMGMMMLPPMVISLPFKVIFFVLIDGWNLVIANLVNSYGL